MFPASEADIEALVFPKDLNFPSPFFPHNSYHQISKRNNSYVKAEEVIKWFGNIEEFVNFHSDFAKSIRQENNWIEKN